jgi:SOS-response transcriptional repressor LexA
MYREERGRRFTVNSEMPTKSPGAIFRELRESRKWSYRDAAVHAGLSHGSIQRAEGGELTSDNVSGHVAKGLGKAYGLSEQTVYDIFAGKYSDIENLKEHRERLKRFEVHPDWVAVPIFGSASAGSATADPLLAELTYVPREMFRRHGSDPARVRAYRVNGSCMVSEEARRMDKNYAHGDTIVVDPDKAPSPGDVVVAWWEEKQMMVLKRFSVEREGIMLYPAAPGHPTVLLAHEDALAVLGPVIWRGG